MKKYEEPINRRVMRQFLIGPFLMGSTLLVCSAISFLVKNANSTQSTIDIRILAFLILTVGFVSTVLVSIRRLFRELLQAKDYFTSIFSSMSNFVIVTDERGNISTVNQSMLESLGHSELDLKGKAIQSLISSKATNPFEKLNLDEGSGEGMIHEVETVFVTKSGEQIPVLLSSSMLKNSEGRVSGMVCLAQDITERKRSETEKQDMQAQLIQASKLASLGTIGSGVAHELNNPLTIVKASAELIRDNIEDKAIVMDSLKEIIHSFHIYQ